MKICIVTVYDSFNSGSFWQAKALQCFLRKKGNDVYFLKRQNIKILIMFKTKKIIKKLINNSIWEAIKEYKKFKMFEKSQKNFNVLKNIKNEKIDYVILGSDTIWNLDSNYFTKYREIYWGGKFKDYKTITYAGSVANTAIDKVNNFTELVQYVNSWNSISVRDEHTYDIIFKMTNKNITLVCDPTLLLTKEDYKNFIEGSLENNYIFLYLFKDLSPKQQKEIQEFAKKENLKIISGTEKRKYCDETIINSPPNFLKYMYYAKYIITDTFHGTVFSVNLKKDFVSINRNKIKVNEFLKIINFSDRLINDDNELLEKLSCAISYDNRLESLDKLRNISIKFLENSIKK